MTGDWISDRARIQLLVRAAGVPGAASVTILQALQSAALPDGTLPHDLENRSALGRDLGISRQWVSNTLHVLRDVKLLIADGVGKWGRTVYRLPDCLRRAAKTVRTALTPEPEALPKRPLKSALWDLIRGKIRDPDWYDPDLFIAPGLIRDSDLEAEAKLFLARTFKYALQRDDLPMLHALVHGLVEAVALRYRNGVRGKALAAIPRTITDTIPFRGWRGPP